MMLGEMLSQIFSSRSDTVSQLCQTLKVEVIRQQRTFTETWNNILATSFESFSSAWLLLDEKERRRRLLGGLEDVNQRSLLGQDSRALCPEITVSALLKQNGRRFIDFAKTYRTKLMEVAVGNLYLVESEWWDKARKDVPQSSSAKFPPSTFECLTLLRTQFISESLTHTLGKPYSQGFYFLS
jgi:hypothetical protein